MNNNQKSKQFGPGEGKGEEYCLAIGIFKQFISA